MLSPTAGTEIVTSHARTDADASAPWRWITYDHANTAAVTSAAMIESRADRRRRTSYRARPLVCCTARACPIAHRLRAGRLRDGSCRDQFDLFGCLVVVLHFAHDDRYLVRERPAPIRPVDDPTGGRIGAAEL